MITAALQYFSSIILFFWVKIFYPNFEIIGKNNLKDAQGPLIIVSNHESHLDPILIGISMLTKPSIFPLRYMAKFQLYLIPGLNILIWLLGAFMIKKGRGLQANLSAPYKILKKNGTVVIFPEGRAHSVRGQLKDGKHGAAALAILTDAAILPIALHTPYHHTPWRHLIDLYDHEYKYGIISRFYLLFKELFLGLHSFVTFKYPLKSRVLRKVKINIGSPYYLDNVDYPDIKEETIDRATNEIMKKIHDLYKQHNYD